MNSNDTLILVGASMIIILITVLYAFPHDALIEALKQSGF